MPDSRERLAKMSMSSDSGDHSSVRAKREMQGKPLTIGWREWVGLPGLGIGAIRAKIDTGARTSTLHADRVVPFEKEGGEFVRFRVRPEKRPRREVECVAPLIDRRGIRDSGGRVEVRYVIATRLSIGNRSWPIELTLTNRDSMSFRMLVGRAAIRGRYRVDPGASYRMGRTAASAGLGRID